MAISDQTLTLARALKTIPSHQLQKELLLIFKQEEIKALVLGLPLEMGGAVGQAARGIFYVGYSLSAHMHRPVYFQDERLSSWDARERLREAGYKPRKIRELEDQVAAKIILQEFLDQHHKRLY